MLAYGSFPAGLLPGNLDKPKREYLKCLRNHLVWFWLVQVGSRGLNTAALPLFIWKKGEVLQRSCGDGVKRDFPTFPLASCPENWCCCLLDFVFVLTGMF